MNKSNKIPFNWPYMTGKELYYIANAHANGSLAGDGPFTKKCHKWLEQYTSCNKALLTHSCTASLEMCALMLDIQAGDEVIMPSYTFVSTANAFVLRGAAPVFVDIREDTLNIDELLIEQAITAKTKAIVAVHYAGVSCEMDTILRIASDYGLKVVEDAAQGVMSTYKGRALGTLGDLGCYSFHETKNVISGEGGATLINDPNLSLKGEIIREKGTNRTQFFRGEVDKYTWQDKGSSFLPGEIVAAFLWAQLEDAKCITGRRLESWNIYHSLFSSLEDQGLIRRPIVPSYCTHNAHMYYILLKDENLRQPLLNFLKSNDISAVFHYVPLHSSPAGETFGRCGSLMPNTDRLSESIIRLPLWVGITPEQQEKVFKTICGFLKNSV
jgi:dTDP-4-amino-4,6-dideoxygalactose transaminase